MTAAPEVHTLPTQVAGLWTLASSMVHGGDETLGTTKLFRTKDMIFEGRRVAIPVVSGNAIRGLWRRACAITFLEAYFAAGCDRLSLSAFYFLTSGGALKKGATPGVDLASERALRQLVPYIGLFGGAGMGRIQAGKLWIDEAVPICRETLPILRRLWPAVEQAETAQLSVRDLTDVHGYSRLDDGKNDHWHRYLSDEGRHDATALVRRAESATEAPAAGTPQQMRYEQVELIAGSVLFHRWGFRWPPTGQETVGLVCGLTSWAERPHVGGRNAVGHGNLLVDYQGVRAETKLIGDGVAPFGAPDATTPVEALRNHVATHRDMITAVLRAL